MDRRTDHGRGRTRVPSTPSLWLSLKYRFSPSFAPKSHLISAAGCYLRNSEKGHRECDCVSRVELFPFSRGSRGNLRHPTYS